MTKFLNPMWVALVTASLAFVGCQKKVTKVEEPPPPPPPPVVVEEPPPPPPPEPVVEDISGRLNELLQPVYFDFDKSDLKYDAISRLEMIASFLREHPSVRLLAQGHADERGSSEYNMGLGENRSKSVRNYLTSYGISLDRIDVTSFGEERPASYNCGNDDYCHGQNRRVDWEVLSK